MVCGLLGPVTDPVSLPGFVHPVIHGHVSKKHERGRHKLQEKYLVRPQLCLCHNITGAEPDHVRLLLPFPCHTLDWLLFWVRYTRHLHVHGLLVPHGVPLPHCGHHLALQQTWLLHPPKIPSVEAGTARPGAFPAIAGVRADHQ